MDKKESRSNYSVYLEHMTNLCKGESDERLKQALKDRLVGGGPPLLRDEGDRLDALILVYSGLKKERDVKALHRLRKVTADLLMESLGQVEVTPSSQASALEQVDYLGHLVAWFEMKEDKGLSSGLGDRLFGFLGHRLEEPPERLMHLEGMKLETGVRVFDLWLASISWDDAFTWPPHLKEYIKNLYKNNLTKLESSIRAAADTHIRLLLLTYRAILRSDPFWVGQEGLAMMTDFLDNQQDQAHDKILRKWQGLCRELKILFKKKIDWRKEFIAGIEESKKNLSLPTISTSLALMGIEIDKTKKEMSILFSYYYADSESSYNYPHSSPPDYLKSRTTRLRFPDSQSASL